MEVSSLESFLIELSEDRLSACPTNNLYIEL